MELYFLAYAPVFLNYMPMLFFIGSSYLRNIYWLFDTTDEELAYTYLSRPFSQYYVTIWLKSSWTLNKVWSEALTLPTPFEHLRIIFNFSNI